MARSTRRQRRSGSLALLAVGAAVLAWTGGATAGGTGLGASDAEIPENSEDWVDPADSIVDWPSFVPAVQAAFGSRFGFVRIDRTDPVSPVIRVGVTDVAAADHVVLAAITSSSQIVLENSVASEAEIVAWKAAAGALMVGLNRNGVLSGDARTGKLLLEVNGLSDAQIEAFIASVPPGVMEIRIDPDWQGVVPSHAVRAKPSTTPGCSECASRRWNGSSRTST